MDHLKKFLKDKKVEKSFKRAGVGHRLTDGGSSATPNHRPAETSQPGTETNADQQSSVERGATADVAAQAAFKRMNLGTKVETAAQKSIRMQALKELEKEQREQQASSALNVEDVRRHMDEHRIEHGGAIEGVYFTCELLGGGKYKKAELREKLYDFLRMQLGGDALVASSLMIYTLNSGEESEIASKTLQAYLRNVIETPQEMKYRRIRFQNKAFQERVLAVKGAVEFLKACGFEDMNVRTEAGEMDHVLLIPEERVHDVEYLIQALEVLQTHEAVPVHLHRNPVVFRVKPNQKLRQPQLSADFYNLSTTEIKKEQENKEADVAKLTTLRTREMRERDEAGRTNRYKFTLLRLRFPDGFILQGVFACNEPVEALRDFLKEFLAPVEPPLFLLKDAAKGTMIQDSDKSLGELNLAPAAVLHFEWDPDVYGELARHHEDVPYLQQRYTDHAQELGTA